MYIPSQNMHVGILMPSVTLLVGGALGAYVMRVEP